MSRELFMSIASSRALRRGPMRLRVDFSIGFTGLRASMHIGVDCVRVWTCLWILSVALSHW